MISAPDCPIVRVDARTPVDVARAVQRRGGSAYVRLARGVYVPTEKWGRLDDREQHLVRVLAVAPALAPGEAFTHETALILHGIRLLDRASPRVMVAEPGRERIDRRSPLLERRPMPPGEVVTVRVGAVEVPVLDLTATAASVARRMSFRAAVVALDQLLRRGVDEADVARLLAKGVRRYALRAKAALEFADARSDSVGETLARIVLHQIGAPRPELQHEFRSRDGRHARVDFWFPDHGVVVEFDGATKYRDAALRNGRSPEQVVIDEKVREDWIRADPTVTAFLRFTSTDLRASAFVAATLRAAGIPAAW